MGNSLIEARSTWPNSQFVGQMTRKVLLPSHRQTGSNPEIEFCPGSDHATGTRETGPIRAGNMHWPVRSNRNSAVPVTGRQNPDFWGVIGRDRCVGDSCANRPFALKVARDLQLFVSQCLHWVKAGCSPSRGEACCNRNKKKQSGDAGEYHRIQRPRFEQHGAN
jgi:hypothetical protein